MTIEPELDDLEQLALAALLDHFEPTDHDPRHYAQGARAVTQALNGPIQFQAMRAWAAELEKLLAQLGQDGVWVTPAGLLERVDQLEHAWEERSAG